MTYVAIAQKAAHMTVALVVAERVETELVNRTDIEEDSIPLQVGCMVVGQIVANKTDRFTDPLVERAALKIAAVKAKIAKKN
jgi:Na+/glutamate symporter